MSPHKKRILADFLLLMVVAVWGATFVTVKTAIETLAPYTFLALRFSIAAIFLTLLTYPKLRANKETAATTEAALGNKLKASALWPGLGAGIILFAGYAFQTLGLQYTSASNAGFITGLSVVLVPIFAAMMCRKNPSIFTWFSVILAGIGLALLTLNKGLDFNKGDILVLLCAISFALQIIVVGRFAPNLDSLVFANYQILGVAMASWAFAFALEPMPFKVSADVWVAIAITAIPATALAFLIQTWAQKFTSSTRLAVIFSGEPVFSAVFAVLWAGEVMTGRAILGSALVLGAMLLAELKGD